MKNYFKKGGHVFGIVFGSILAMSAAQSAYAVAPANSIITNTATLQFTAGGATTSLNASVDVNVQLLSASPTVLASPADTVGETQTGTLNYIVRSNANGPEAITFGTASVAGSVAGSAAPSTPLSITLGATAASLAGAGSVITVPADGIADSNVNGIAAGDTVFIGAATYSVASVVDNATGSSTITLGTALAAAIATGDLIVEQQTVTVTQVVGTVTTPATAGTETVTLTATPTVAASASNTGVINVLKLQFTKLVSVNGSAFTTTAQNAAQGDTVTYRMVVTVPAGVTFNATTITDTIPTFTTYVPASTTLDVDGPANAANGPAVVADVVGVSPLVAGMAINSAAQLPGDVAGGAAGTEVSVEFQVTVD